MRFARTIDGHSSEIRPDACLPAPPETGWDTCLAHAAMAPASTTIPTTRL